VRDFDNRSTDKFPEVMSGVVLEFEETPSWSWFRASVRSLVAGGEADTFLEDARRLSILEGPTGVAEMLLDAAERT